MQISNITYKIKTNLLTIRWRIIAFPKLVYGVVYDLVRFSRYSATFSFGTEEVLIGRIVRYYHSLEKGLSLRSVKPVFGIDVATRLLDLMKVARHRGLDNHIQLRAARAVLVCYAKHLGSDMAGRMPGLLDLATNEPESNDSGGVIVIQRDELLSAAKGDFSALLTARRSVRWFNDMSVDEADLTKVITMAQQSPSVCNRQPGRVYYTVDPMKIEEALALQDGNRGFGKSVKALLVVASEVSVFGGPDERNQVFIDGGLFAMTLMYSLTYSGLASCPLNWMVDPKRDRQLRNLLSIKDSQTIVMLIAVGHMPESIKIAKSCRNELSEVAMAL